MHFYITSRRTHINIDPCRVWGGHTTSGERYRKLRPETLGSGGTEIVSGGHCLQGRRFLSAALGAAADVALSGRHCVSREDEGQTGSQRRRKHRRRRNVACWENILNLARISNPSELSYRLSYCDDE